MTNTEKHTPGPWVAALIKGSDIEHAILPSHIPSYWKIDPPPGNNGASSVAHAFGPQMEANAALIARAPALLAQNKRLREVVQAVVDWYENAGNADPDQSSAGSAELWSKARAALNEKG